VQPSRQFASLVQQALPNQEKDIVGKRLHPIGQSTYILGDDDARHVFGATWASRPTIVLKHNYSIREGEELMIHAGAITLTTFKSPNCAKRESSLIPEATATK